MTYFKVIQDDKVISVGCVFLKWNTKRHRLFICDVDEGQFVETFDEKYIFKDIWMKPAPEEADPYPYAKVVIIDLLEYEDLLALLQEGETVTLETVPEVARPVVQTEVQEEKPMSIAEMREILLMQQQQINSLMEKIN